MSRLRRLGSRLFTAALALSAVPLGAQPVPVGSPFQVNTYTTGSQGLPSVGVDAIGAFVVVWSSDGSASADTDSYSVLGQRFASDGTPTGQEFLVNTGTTGSQNRPQVARNSEGFFVVVWETIGDPADENRGVRAQRYASDGSTLGGEIQVNSVTTGDQEDPTVDMREDGSFVVAFVSDKIPVLYEHVARAYTSDGNAVGDQFVVTDRELDNTPLQAGAQPDGNFVFTWGDFNPTRAQLFASDGSAIGDSFRVPDAGGDRDPKIDVDGDGNFLIAWTAGVSTADDSDPASVRAQRFDSAGSALGTEFQVNTVTEGSQSSPAVSLLESGESVIVWQDETDDDIESLHGAYFEADGTRSGDDFVIREDTSSFLRGVQVDGGGQGHFVVTWSSSETTGPDTDSGGIWAQRFEIIHLEGQVFFDENLDGLRGAGEAAMAGVVVNLYDAADGSLVDSTVTDGAGAYLFANRPQASILEFEAPAGFAFTFQDRGDDDSVDSDVDRATGSTGQFQPTEVRIWDAGLTNGVGDRVWLDTDADGLQDGGEPGVEGVTVELFSSDGTLLRSTATDGDGRYAFTDLEAGEYYLVFGVPESFERTAQGQGSDGEVDSDADPVTGETLPFTFARGDLRLDLDAGLIEIGLIELVAGPDPRGETDELQVNSTTTGFQNDPAVARLTDGSFVVVWDSGASAGDDFDQLSIQLQRYASDGSALGDEEQVNTTTTGSQTRPDVAAAPDGGFWVTWESDVSAGGSLAEDSIQLRRFDASGAGVGAETQVNEVTTGARGDPSIAIADDGGAVVAWAAFSGGSLAVPARVFDSSGTAVGGQFTVSNPALSDQYLGEVAALDSGEFLVVWSATTASSGRQILGRRVGTGGAAGGADFQISQNGASYYPSAAAHRDGFVAVWEQPNIDALTGRFFDFEGQALASEFALGATANYKVIEPISEDRFMVAWRQPNDGSSVGVQGQLVDFPGEPVGLAFQINSYTTGVQDNPRLATDVDRGQVLAVWESAGSPEDDDDGDSVLAQLLRFPAEIGDFVFFDGDFDGVQDPAEAALEGVGVELLDAEGRAIGQTSTDVDGRYRFFPFLNEPQGGESFQLRFTAPADLAFTRAGAGGDDVDSDPDPDTGATAPFLIRGAGVDDRQDAGFAAGVGDRVWLDADGNGVQDGGEAGLADVTVSLLDGDGAEIEQTTTAADGGYAFYALGSGVYAIEVQVPAGFGVTLRDQGEDDSDSDVNAAGQTSAFLYLEGTIRDEIDAGLVPEALGSIGDRVWLDANLNGLQDGGEPGFEGVVVELFDAGGVSLGTATTDATGAYVFSDLGAGEYSLGFSEPSGFCYTARDQGGDDAVDSDVDPQTFTTSSFFITPGVTDSTRDAGLVPDASIGNRVWLDNGDGLQAGGEPGVEGVTVRLYDSDDALLGTTTTDATGAYAFSPGPGDYYLEFELPPNTAFAPGDRGTDDGLDSDPFPTGFTSPFSLGPGQVDTTRDAGLEPAAIGNLVWDDRNADGRQQPGEPGQRGVTVRLLDASDAEVATTTTDAQGLYQFLGIPTGTYRIEVELPVDGVFSTQDVGANALEADLIDSDVDPANGRSSLFSYEAGSANRRWDAGLRILPIFADGFESGDTSAWSGLVN
ncbi:MAG: SdrD B-like domain-containing protein [Acidobacteriota bacterium]